MEKKINYMVAKMIYMHGERNKKNIAKNHWNIISTLSTLIKEGGKENKIQ